MNPNPFQPVVLIAENVDETCRFVTLMSQIEPINGVLVIPIEITQDGEAR